MQGLLTNVPPDPHLGLFCANATPPVGDQPALLTHSEVETLFHEFGHLMHHLLSKVTVRSLGGTSVAWDFVELPSQIMENWCWEREALDLFARHWETGEKIPDALYEKMTRARTYRAANAQMRQLGFATVDLALHVQWEPRDTEAHLLEYARRILQAHSPTKLPTDYAMICGFSHLFASPVAYAAGYYSYKWAEVLDADAFSRFKEHGVFDPDVGQAFKDAILSQGDSRDPMELYQDFMGREPRLEPLFERQGLTS
jgi:oligopeptidase A